MAINFGNDKIKDIYVGSEQIEEVYYGSELVWYRKGFWVHKDTGVKTYFGLDDPSIRNGIMDRPSWWLNCAEVRLPPGITGLGSNCFYKCNFLTSIIIPEGVTSLGNSCFEDTQSLTSITLPASVTSLGRYCFNRCRSLALATVLPAIPPSLGTNAFNQTHTSLNIKVRSPYVDDYKTATNWTAYANKISAI